MTSTTTRPGPATTTSGGVKAAASAPATAVSHQARPGGHRPAGHPLTPLHATLGAATVAVVQGLLVVVVCLIAGFRPVSAAMIPVALLFMTLIACLFSALGTAIGSVLQNMQGLQLIMNFMVMPMFFLSGALFPLAHLPKLLGVVTSLDPLAYGVDGMRSALIGTSHFGVTWDLGVLVVVAAVILCIGTYLFSKIEA